MNINYNIEELACGALDYLKNERQFAPLTIKEYGEGFNRIKRFMKENEIKYFNHELKQKMFPIGFTTRNNPNCDRKTKRSYQFLRNLLEFQQTGKIVLTYHKYKQPIVFSGPMSGVINNFLDSKKTESRITENTLGKFERSLLLFCNYCDKKEIQTVNSIGLADILHFIDSLKDTKKPVKAIIAAVRAFMKYAYEQKQIDHFINMPKYRSVNQPKLPSSYSQQEIEKLILSIDRSSGVGKRNYIIILLAAKLGLRASDISLLKLKNINWDNSTIQITQFKTGKELLLPLLPDIGNAIIDYLKYVRRDVNVPYLLLIERPPYARGISSCVVTSVVQLAFTKAKLAKQGRKIGAHSLRHSLAARMLEQSTVLPVISSVLGHENMESTKYYLRIDLKSMSQCMLEVPPVSTSFYTQKGGLFYA